MKRQFGARFPANTWDDIHTCMNLNPGSNQTQLAIEAFSLLRQEYERRDKEKKSPKFSDGLAEKSG